MVLTILVTAILLGAIQREVSALADRLLVQLNSQTFNIPVDNFAADNRQH
jgi:hypothetical protein